MLKVSKELSFGLKNFGKNLLSFIAFMAGWIAISFALIAFGAFISGQPFSTIAFSNAGVLFILHSFFLEQLLITDLRRRRQRYIRDEFYLEMVFPHKKAD